MTQIPTVAKVLSVAKALNECEIGQEALEQMQMVNLKKDIITQEPPAHLQIDNSEDGIITQQSVAQIEMIFANSPIAKLNWAS